MASTSPIPQKHISIDYRNPLLTGHLFKQNKIGSFFTKRYFALYPKYLVYYAHEADYRKDVQLNTLEERTTYSVFSIQDLVYSIGMAPTN